MHEITAEEEEKARRLAMSLQYQHAASVQEKVGNHIIAGLLRVEAGNILDRPLDWKPVHKPNLGPYSRDNPCYCVNCGKVSEDVFSADWGLRSERYCDQSLVEGFTGGLND